MSTLSDSILKKAHAMPEGGVVSPSDFNSSSRREVVQVFSRLARKGELLRVARGIYVVPVSGRFGLRAPAPERVVEALAKQSGETVAPHGASDANTLGLTRQVPVREVFWTTGPTRTLKVGSSEVLLKHVPSWLLALGKSQAGSAIRALAWIGESHADSALETLHNTLPGAVWQTLTSPSVREILPSWLAEAIGEAAGG